MPNVTINFGGQTLFIPGAYFNAVNQQTLPPLPTVPPLLFVGYFYGIKPKTVNTYLSAQDAINAVSGSPGATYLTPIALPSPAVNGANFISLIDASENTASHLSLPNSAATNLISVSGLLYGPPGNLLQGSVSPAPTSGVTLEIYNGNNSQTYVGNNLGYPFLLAYTGNATGAVSYSVSGPTGAVTGFVVSSPLSGQSFTVPVGSATYPTISSLVEYLNGTGFYSAVLLSDTQGQGNAQQLDVTSGSLPVTAVASGYSYVGIPSSLYDPIYWINQFANTVASAALSTANVSSGTLAPIALTSFSGAQGVPPTLSDYATALNLGLNTPAWVVFIDSNGIGEQTLLAQHCETASETQNSAWRRGMTGSTVGDSVATTEANAEALGSKQVGYVYPGITIVNTNTGLVTTYGGLYAAAACAGILCGNAIALPLTNKPLNGVNVEVNLTNSELEALQAAGVVCLRQLNNQPTILSDVSTWQTDNNPENVFLQQVGNVYWVGYTLVAAAQPYVGGIAAPSTQIAIANAVIQALNNLIYTDVGPGVGTNGVLAAWNTASLVVIYNGNTQQWEISVDIQPVGQNRFITMTAYVSPYSTTS